MKFTDLEESIKKQFASNKKVHYMILGAPGGGKTELARKIGRDLQFDNVVEFNASLRDPVDLLGTPNNNGETTKWIKPDDLACLESGRNLLILEEITDSIAPMQNALCGLIHDGVVGNLHLSQDTYIIATGNRTEDKSGANRLSTKLANRMRIMDFDVNTNDFIDYWLGNGMDLVQIQFLRFRESLISAFDPNARVSPTPRAWERVSKIPTDLRSDLYFANVAGDVGEGAAAEFVAFRQIYQNLPNIDELMMHPSKAVVPTKMDVLYALTGAIANRIDKDNFDRVIEFIDRMPPEFSVMCVSDAMRLKPEIKQTKAFVKWAVSNSGLVI